MKTSLKLSAAVLASALFASPVFAAPAPKAASGSTIQKVQPAPTSSAGQSVKAGTIGKVDPPGGSKSAPTTNSGPGFDHIVAPTTSGSAPSRSGGVTRDPPGHKAHPG